MDKLHLCSMMDLYLCLERNPHFEWILLKLVVSTRVYLQWKCHLHFDTFK